MSKFVTESCCCICCTIYNLTDYRLKKICLHCKEKYFTNDANVFLYLEDLIRVCSQNSVSIPIAIEVSHAQYLQLIEWYRKNQILPLEELPKALFYKGIKLRKAEI